MGDGEAHTDNSADDPTHRLLPREDRVWRHPSEAAMEARAAIDARGSRHHRFTATLLSGIAATAAIVWLAQGGSTDVSVSADLGSAVDEPAAALLAPVSSLAQTLLAPDSAPTSLSLTVRSSSDATPLAGALLAHDSFVITSGRALEGAREVVLTWGSRTVTGVVIGYDAVTDVSVIRIDGPPPDAERGDAGAVTAGDLIHLAGPDGTTATQVVVDAMSASARSDGEPVVGIVELDGTLGSVRPGSPALDIDGAIVGMVTRTADDAPVAVVPIKLVRVVAAEIIDLGAATHPLLGVRARNATDDDGNPLVGSLVTAVTSDGPAAAGGMEVGDLIIEIEGDPVHSMEAMVATLRSHEPGDQVVVVVLRSGEPVNCSVQLGSQSGA